MNTISLPSVYPVTGHTDFVGQGTTFVAISGSKQNGLDFVPLALQKGAKKIVLQSGTVIPPELASLIDQNQAVVEYVADCRKALALMSAQALDYPANKLKIAAITGTKGKTSTSYMAYHMLHAAGKKVALVSTVEKRIGDGVVDMPLTTPLADQLQMFLAECVRHDIEFVIMEVSAQALTLHRVEGITFDAGVFTNFSHEHLEFYDTLQDYFYAKTVLFQKIKSLKNMFVNIDDEHGATLHVQYPKTSTFSLQSTTARLFAHDQQVKNSMIDVTFDGVRYQVCMPFLGTFNIYNLLAALGIVTAFGVNISDVAYALTTLPRIPGRMEMYPLKNGARCFIDYAHNPSSFESVLCTLRAMTPHLIVIFGCGGNRDKQKRPIMGSIAQKYCDVVILTSDNPRSEKASVIAQEIEQGFTATDSCNFYKELDRAKAIELGCSLSKSDSIVAILGKGRDEYQIIGDVTIPFKETLIIKQFMHESDHGFGKN